MFDLREEPGAGAPAAACSADRRRWYVVQTHAHKEHTAEMHLRRQGFAVFLPQIRKTVRIMRRTREVLGPLFPRYMFVALDLESESWRRIRSTIGVRSLIMDGDRPRAVPDGIVEELAQHAAPSDGMSPESRLVVGCDVRFVRGPFTDRIGQLFQLRDLERAVVLLKMLGAERSVTVPASQVLPSRTVC